MKTILVLLSAFVVGIVAGPVKRECGQTCFNSTNLCGDTFSGCWDECSSERPTLTAPLCSVTASEAAPPPFQHTIDITTNPATNPTVTRKPDPDLASEKTGCHSGTVLCADYLLVCNGRNLMYGGCDDICSSKTYTPPPCSVTPVPTVSWSGNESEVTPTKGKAKAKRPPTTRTPCNPDKPRWMCAPLDW